MIVKPQHAKSGRPRRYDLYSDAGEQDPVTDLGQFVAALDELQHRVLDQISDLTQAALDFVPQGAANSIATLVIHMAWAEASWISTVTQTPLPSEVARRLQPGRQAASGDILPASETVSGLMELCRDVRLRVTKPALAALRDIDEEVCVEPKSMTARGVLMHLVWHWTYHSGQVGLLRRLWGARYRWTFDDRLGAPRSPDERCKPDLS